ncbi:SDR family NAD(P)-dependent oxidoreductase [Streptomyces sp. NPDC091377]|uniref:SDR family NAD(P)-dependent oxidoreductase n=1 Tax=Streptomyces sp. NPDC091377 TaxID=3365995 RepID=UPI00380D1696
MTTALVTGASYGIGADLARALAARGHDLVLVARSAGLLDALAARLRRQHGVKVRVLRADLCEPDALEEVAGAARGVDIVVNNAGTAPREAYDATGWPDEGRLLTLHVTVPSRLIHAALPAMLDRGQGRILTVSSVAALGPAWGQGTTYGATKAYQLALTESLAYASRVRASPVALTALVLGHTASRLHEVAGIPLPPKWLTLPSSFVAERAVAVIHRRRPPVVCVPGVRYKVLAPLLRHLPHRLLTLPRLADDFTR